MVIKNFFGLLVVAAALLMLSLAAWIYFSSKNARFREKVTFHFDQVLPHGATISGVPPGARETYWHKLRVRASIYVGFELHDWHFIAIPLFFSVFGFLGWLWLKWIGAVLFFGGGLFVFGFLLPYSRLQRRQALVISQIPIFIDQVLRSLSTGRSVEGAIRLGADEAPVPLKHVLERVIRATDLGADMPETLSQAAQLHRLRELSLIALAMRISNSYGSSPKDMLQSVVHMIRQRELAQRELAAMTGETRISAWVLGMTPIALGGYMLVMNPNYMELMLHQPSGHLILGSALALQAIGGFLLWRMLKSV
jgi:tight adherence protein B